MIVGVADTHAALWYLFDDSRLSVTAGSFIDEAEASGNRIAVSSTSLVEVVYLIEKRRLPESAYAALARELADSSSVFVEAVFTAETVEAMRTVSRDEVPDMPDRMIAATAVLLGVPLLTRDRRILSSKVEHALVKAAAQ